MSVLISCLYVLMYTGHKKINPYLIRVSEIIGVIGLNDSICYRHK